MSPLRISGRSHVGRVRTSNQDHYFVGVLHKSIEVCDTNLAVTEAVEELSRLDADLLVVADGVGGSRGGERASRCACT